MSQELHYTSVARGLRPGSRGFGTVAATANLPEALADRLEALSAYEAVYPPGDPAEALNPVAYAHVRLTVAGYVQDVLSRIGPAGLDYSGRPNKYAHHIILEPEERPDGGPAWLLTRPGFVRDAWEGEPRVLDGGPPVPRGDHPAGVARAWQELTGDAGWAGVLAESFLADPRRPVFLVFRPGMELLPLFVEAIAMLPVARRWDVEFSTYLTTMPPGVSCTWRGVLDGSRQAKGARRLPGALVVDLVRPLGRATGGGLVHLARTGERREVPEAPAPASPRQEVVPPPVLTAGPPPRPPAPRRAPDDDRLPDLAVRLAGDEPLLVDDRRKGRRGSPAMVAALIVAAGLVPMLGAILASPALRQRLGLEAARRVVPEGAVAPTVAARPEAPAPPVAPVEKPKADEAPGPPTVAVAEAKAPAKADPTPAVAARPAPIVPRPPAGPLLLTFATPDVPRSTLASPARKDGAIRIPEDTEDRVELRNGPDFLVRPAPGVPTTWEVSTRTGSGLGGGFALARLTRAEPRTWRFEWTKAARARSSPVEGLRDAVLELRGRDGRPIYVLLRGVEPDSERPILVWDRQKLLFENPDPRIRTVEWADDPDRLEGTHWRPRIRRWEVVISRPADEAAGEDDAPRRVIGPEPAGEEAASGGEPALRRDLIPGEVTIKLAIDPSRPGTIDVRIEPNPAKIRSGRDGRSARLDELGKATPKDKDGNERDPLEYRRARLHEIRGDGTGDPEELESMKKEVAELEKIRQIQETEGLLTRPARVELSVVIGLDVDGPGMLDIARIGAFAHGR